MPSKPNQAEVSGDSPNEYVGGRRERLAREQSRERIDALGAFRALMHEEARDDDLRSAWWRAVRLGCDLSPNLREAGRAACLREQRRRAVAADGDAGADTMPPHYFPQPPSPTLAQLLAVGELDQWRALQGLRTALEQNDPRQIARAAELARMSGAFDPEIPWAGVEDAEALTQVEGELHAALRAEDVSGAATAWFRARSVWPRALNQGDDRAGRDMFRAWGHTMRRSAPKAYGQ